MGARPYWLAALDRYSESLQLQGRLNESLAVVQKWAVAEPFDETAQRRLMRLYALGGDRARAIHSYQAFARLLQTEVIEGDELRRILTESGALPLQKKGPGAEAEHEERENQSQAPPFWYAMTRSSLSRLYMVKARPSCLSLLRQLACVALSLARPILLPVASAFVVTMMLGPLSAHAERYGTTDDLVIGFQLTHSGRFCRPHDKRWESRIAFRHPILDKKFNVTSDDQVFTDAQIEELERTKQYLALRVPGSFETTGQVAGQTLPA